MKDTLSSKIMYTFWTVTVVYRSSARKLENVDPLSSIDFRYDDEKKKSVKLGRHLGIIALLKTSGCQKCRSLTLSKHLFIRKLKKTILHGLSIPNPTFSEFAIFGK